MANLCDRCPQPAKHTIVIADDAFLRACDHHAREWQAKRPLTVWDDDAEATDA